MSSEESSYPGITVYDLRLLMAEINEHIKLISHTAQSRSGQRYLQFQQDVSNLHAMTRRLAYRCDRMRRDSIETPSTE